MNVYRSDRFDCPLWRAYRKSGYGTRYSFATFIQERIPGATVTRTYGPVTCSSGTIDGAGTVYTLEFESEKDYTLFLLEWT